MQDAGDTPEQLLQLEGQGTHVPLPKGAKPLLQTVQ